MALLPFWDESFCLRGRRGVFEEYRKKRSPPHMNGHTKGARAFTVHSQRQLLYRSVLVVVRKSGDELPEVGFCALWF